MTVQTRYAIVGASYGLRFFFARMPDCCLLSDTDKLAWTDNDVSFRSVL